MSDLLVRMTGLGTCGFPETAEQEFFPWPAAPPCPAGLVLVYLNLIGIQRSCLMHGEPPPPPGQGVDDGGMTEGGGGVRKPKYRIT